MINFSEKSIKGKSTELQCAAAFAELGFNVLFPFGGQERYDIVVDTGEKFLRIQCKSASLYSGGNRIRFDTRSTNHKNSTKESRHYTKDEIDYFATAYDGKCYVVPVEEVDGMSAVSIYLKKTKYTPNQNPKMGSDYEIRNVFGSLSFKKNEIS